MKTINIMTKSLWTLALLALVSCNGFLDVTPHNATSDENSLETIVDYNMLMRDPYSSQRNLMSSFYILIPDVMSDNLTICSAGRSSFNELFDFKFNSTTYGVSPMWTSSYNGIMDCNEIIVRLEGGKNPFIGTADEAMSKNILAEALAMRAFLHFQLVRVYGKDYKVASETDLGVTYKETSIVDLPSRNTVKDVYEKIIRDFEKAKSLMTADFHQKDNTRLNVKSLGAIMARVYLTMGNYQEAINNATLAIAGDGSDIATAEQFAALWTTSMDSPEVLLRYPILSIDNLFPGNNWGQGKKESHKAEYVASAAFVDLLKNNDLRVTSVLTPVLSGGHQFIAVWKWHGRTGESAGVVDIPAIRVSEMYLTRAEAYYKIGGNEDKALKDLNYLRAKRYSGFVSPDETGQYLEEVIALERRLELAFEGDRFFELKRKGQNVVRDKRGDFSDGTGTPPSTLNVLATSPYYLLPIPQDEMDANDNMQQNEY